VSAVTIPVSDTFFEYRGRRYRRQSGGDDFVRVYTDAQPTIDTFPDAQDFSVGGDQPWVALPRDVLTARYSQEVTGRWRGTSVRVEGVVPRSGGKVTIRYLGNCPDEAVSAGFDGNQNDGWSATVPPSEVEDVRVETTKHPMVTR